MNCQVTHFVNGIQFIPGNKKLVHHASYQVLEIAEGCRPDHRTQLFHLW